MSQQRPVTLQPSHWIRHGLLSFKGSFSVLLLMCCLAYSAFAQLGTQSACYDKNGLAKTCLTYPKNVALNRQVTATDTCGTPSETSCQIGANTDRCRVCDARVPQSSHPARNMVDFHNPVNITWWQSTTWWQSNLKGVSTLADPLKVNVTLSFDKLYLVSGGVRVTFYTVRPKKMAIQRSRDYGETWSTYQYFAKNCQNFYGLPADPTITTANRFGAACTEKFSSELPHIGGIVVFDPRLTRYENAEYQSPVVQSYLSATDIRLLLEYPGTDGRENIDSSATLNQYYYAISDVVVDARCHCHGHAEYCDFKNGTEACDCQHFTTGKDCEFCLPLYNNRVWMPGNLTDANECQKCQCNNHASTCTFNQTLGFGVCRDCIHNTTGYNCESCIDSFYPNASVPLSHINVCIPCDCFISGISDNGSCLQRAGPSGQLGQCTCKPDVYGRRCDQCVPGKWGFSTPPIGSCFDCVCNIFGTVGSNETCDSYTGQCRCQVNIQGTSCSECRDAFHSFPTSNSSDCQPCGCHIAGGFPVCNKKTGDCTCRRGITGKQCSFTAQGFFFPNFTHVNFEVEMVSQVAQDYFWMLKGYRSTYMGIGKIKLSSNQSVSYSFQVPVSYRYVLLLRYSLFPSTWLNTLFLYEAETLSWSGSDLVSTYTTSSDKPTSWTITIKLFDATNTQLASSQLSIADLQIGDAKTWNDSSVIQLSQGQIYRLTLTYEARSNSGNPWPILVDSVVLLPDLAQNSYFVSQTEAAKSEIMNCRMFSSSLTSTYRLPSACKEHVFGSSIIMYNGSLACDCFTPGLFNTTNCESYGGQCYCKDGYGGRRCDHCLAGFYGNPNTGCIACECSTMGSLTPVCNQTNGQCFCKANTQGVKCGQCKSGTFAMLASNPDGCQSCFAFGHSVSCKTAQYFVMNSTLSDFTLGRSDGWHQIDEFGGVVNSALTYTSNGLQYTDEGSQIRFLSAPSKFLGNQLNSYGQRFSLQVNISSKTSNLIPRDWQVRLIGGGMTVVFSLFPKLSEGNSSYFFLLHEKFTANDTKLSDFEFKSLLGQLSAIHVRLSLFQSSSTVRISKIEMTSASFKSSAMGSSFVSHVENATCRIGYEGLSCERCAQGYTRAIPNGGPLVNCVSCSCNGRSAACHPQSGICINCRIGTTGDHCETCMPNLMLPNCTSCMPGFWKISSSGCEPCNCYLPGTINGSSKSCDLITGQCKCNSSMNVAGRQCNQCKQNAYNISLGELQCKQCPPCYVPIEKGYIEIRYQNEILKREIASIWNNPAIVPKIPLDQSVTALSVTVDLLTTQARASVPNVTSLDSLWSSLKVEVDNLQSALATITPATINNASLTVTQLLTSYNQSFASVVAISTNIVSSHNRLTTSVANIVSQQAVAIAQLGVLRNNTIAYLATIRSLLTQADSMKSTAVLQASQSIQTASVAANNSESSRSLVQSLNSSLASLRSTASAVLRQGSEVNALAMEMRANASAVSSYATQLQSNITAELPDHSQGISLISTTTTSLRSQINNLNSMITASTRDNNGIEQQISILKQSIAIQNSQISTTDRRLDAVKATVSSASLISSAAVSSAINTEKEAVSMLDITSNFQSVSQTAANDALSALTRVNVVLPSVYEAGNISANVSSQLVPLQKTVDGVQQSSTQANQIGVTEKQNLDPLQSRAVNLRNDANLALNVIRTTNVQQYIDSSVSPLLSRCQNYTLESIVLAANSATALAQSQSSYTTARTISTSVVNIATSAANIPSIDRSQLAPVSDNLLRVRQAFSVLDISGDLAYLRAGIERIKLVASDYRTKIVSLKSTINAYKDMYNSLNALNCNAPLQTP